MPTDLERINRRRAELRACTDEQIKAFDRTSLIETFAAACEAARRVLGLDLFDVQILGALALCQGHIAEMQTGEGKTLAAVPAVAFSAMSGKGVHVLTVNDYLARRDAQWMGDIYRFLGLTVGYVSQGMSIAERQHAYNCDITYATANEVGFDFLRDNLCTRPEDLVQRPFHCAVIDEADSILIDEARIPLVIAGGSSATAPVAVQADHLVRRFHRHVDYLTDEYGRNVQLTDAGIRKAEATLGCSNLFE